MRGIISKVKRHSLVYGSFAMLAVLGVLIGLQANPTAAQQAVQQVPGAPPGPYCADSQHDPTKWHPAVDPVTGCWYGHEHGSNPQPANSPFAPLVFGGDEATPNENLYKHNGYKVFYINYANPNSPDLPANRDTCKDIRVRVHMDVTPREKVGQYHSFEAAVAHCKNGQRDVSYIQGWVDFGTVVRVSTREGGDPGIRPMKFAPSPADFAANGLNIWEVWYGRSGLGLDMGWLMGEVPTLFHDGSDPNNPATWKWTGGAGYKRKIENFNFYGWRETRRGEFYTDPFGNSVDPNSDACKTGKTQCLRQYVSPLFGNTKADQIIFNLAYNNEYDATGVKFPQTFPADGGHLPWYQGGQPTTVPPTPVATQNPTGPALRVDVAPTSASVGSKVDVSLSLLNVSNLYGLQAQCAVDPTVLAGVARSDGDGFNAKNSFFVDNGFKSDGKWTVAASRLQPNPAITGNAVAFKLTYNVLKAAATPVNCSVMAVDVNGKVMNLQVINGSFGGAVPTQDTPVPTLLPTEVVITPPPGAPTPEKTPPPSGAATISGVAQYQNRPDNAGIKVQVFSAADTTKPLAEVTTQADGAYTFTDVPAGSYGLLLSAGDHLMVGKAVTVGADGQSVDVGALVLPAGDTNGDNQIDLADASLIGANFSVSVPPAPAAADINADKAVDVRDLVLIGGNFGMKGPVTK
jgi:hypothetical protein